MSILCPQPKRPLKRKLLEEFGCPLPSKKQFLADVTYKRRTRSYSDSLLLKMSSSSRPQRETRAPKNFDDTYFREPATTRVKLDNRRYSTSSSPSLSNAFPAMLPPPVLSPDSLRADTSSPATSFSRSVSRSEKSCSPYSSNYRDYLLANRIEVDPDDVPSSIKEYSDRIIQASRTSPQMSMGVAREAVASFRALREGDEDTVKWGYAASRVMQHPVQLNMGSNVPMNWQSLPRGLVTASVLPTPKPDLQYCFNTRHFTEEEHAKQNNNALGQYAKPSSAGFWPYFTVEFKSVARGGNQWVAENQNAGNGALCVNGMEQLLQKLKTETLEVDSICFSCNIEARRAAIWVHYCKENKIFSSSEVSNYDMFKPDHVIGFHTSLKNIHQFALETRLPKIKAVLAKIALPDLEQEVKGKRVRRASQIE